MTTIWALSQSERSISPVAMEIMMSRAKNVIFPAKITFCGCALLEIKFTALFSFFFFFFFKRAQKCTPPKQLPRANCSHHVTAVAMEVIAVAMEMFAGVT